MELEDLSIVEKAAMLSGGSEWDSRGNDRADIPGFVMSDGPHGVRRQLGEGDHLGIGSSKPATCFPTACTVADAATPYFTSVSVLDTSGRARCTDIKTFLGFSSQLYMNAESLYLSGARYDGGAKTQLVRFSRTGDGLEFAAEGCVPGSLLNQFSMDEYDGVLRVAVTETDRNGESTNSLYTLDRKSVV